jgi:uncharacterized protein (DUF433 family)
MLNAPPGALAARSATKRARASGLEYAVVMTGALNERITHDPSVMGGRPCIRGLRVTVGTIVGLLASGHDAERILELYPYLEQDDISAALSYAAWRVEEVELPLRAS